MGDLPCHDDSITHLDNEAITYLDILMSHHQTISNSAIRDGVTTDFPHHYLYKTLHFAKMDQPKIVLCL
jgi:hypothetical protein